MVLTRTFLATVIAGIALALPALAQAGAPGTITAPDYGSHASTLDVLNGNFNTPEADGRPGVEFFALGVRAFRARDYEHAVSMYKVAASWAYKPAEYNLGVMYFKGQGIPTDRARGAAWMVLAAERGTPLYVRARDLMVTALTAAEFAQTDVIWNQLKPTYGDAVALQRAKAKWNWVRTHQTGTRVGGGVGNLRIGGIAAQGLPFTPSTGEGGAVARVATNWTDLLGNGSIDGSVAYRQFRESDNPYDPVFIEDKDRDSTVTLEPLQQIKADPKSSQGTPHEPAGAGSSDR